MSMRSCLVTLRAGLARIHPVDKSLLLFMVLLLLQSAYSIFFPSEVNPAVGDIDVIIRTSSAAIFGYFLSANFVNRSSVQTEMVSAPAALTTAAQAGSEVSAPKSQIGFTAEDTAMESGGTQSTPSPSLPAPPEDRRTPVSRRRSSRRRNWNRERQPLSSSWPARE